MMPVQFVTLGIMLLGAYVYILLPYIYTERHDSHNTPRNVRSKKPSNTSHRSRCNTSLQDALRSLRDQGSTLRRLEPSHGLPGHQRAIKCLLAFGSAHATGAHNPQGYH